MHPFCLITFLVLSQLSSLLMVQGQAWGLVPFMVGWPVNNQDNFPIDMPTGKPGLGISQLRLFPGNLFQIVAY